jgi:hypothetical protein
VVAPARRAVNEEIAAPVPANVTESDRLEGFAVARRHDVNKSGTPTAALGTVGSGSIKVASSSLARELFTLFDTGHLRSTPSAAGLSNSTPALPESQGSN